MALTLQLLSQARLSLIENGPHWYITSKLLHELEPRVIQRYDTMEKAANRAAALCREIPLLYTTEDERIKERI